MVDISRFRGDGGTKCSSVSVWVLVLSNLLVFQLGWHARGGGEVDESSYRLLMLNGQDQLHSAASTKGGNMGLSSSLSSSSDFILAPPQGEAQNLPSIRVKTEQFNSDERYGGKGDKAHLGGWTDMDHHGVSPAAWKWMVKDVGIHSLIDVGCGRGISTSWFYFHGVDVRCVEGSHDAVENTVLPEPKLITEHDFSRGPWWPEKTYDAVWCVEFLEHVGRNYRNNYVATFRKAALIFATHSNWGGYHHVEVHDEDYWLTKFSMMGFIYSKDLTMKLRREAHEERSKGFAPNGNYLNAQHVWLGMQVFINPAVASLPQHAHLLAEPGCFLERKDGTRRNRECGSGAKDAETTESVLPKEFRALQLTPAQDDNWFQYVKARVKRKDIGEKPFDPVEEEN